MIKPFSFVRGISSFTKPKQMKEKNQHFKIIHHNVPKQQRQRPKISAHDCLTNSPAHIKTNKLASLYFRLEHALTLRSSAVGFINALLRSIPPLFDLSAISRV